MKKIMVHDKKQSFVLNLIMLNSIISGLMRHCRYQPGLRRVGYIRKILEDGFNGIAGIIWGVGFLEKMSGRSKDGKPLRCVTWEQLKKTVLRKMKIAGENKNRPCCTGHMMRGNYEG